LLNCVNLQRHFPACPDTPVESTHSRRVPPMQHLEQSEIQDLVLAALEEGFENELARLIDGMHPADIADLLEGLTPEQRPPVWRVVDVSKRGEVLVEIAEGVG